MGWSEAGALSTPGKLSKSEASQLSVNDSIGYIAQKDSPETAGTVLIDPSLSKLIESSSGHTSTHREKINLPNPSNSWCNRYLFHY